MQLKSSYTTDLPGHIAIIMDGNGRWAKARRRPRTFGHKAGVKTVRRIVEDASEIGIKCLTLYSFSTENWTRPKAEIATLFSLLKQYVEDDLDTLDENNVRIRILGSRKGLRPDLLEVIKKVERRTEHNSKFLLNIAFNYGGQDEVLRAVGRAIQAGLDGTKLTPVQLSRFLDTADLPDLDLLIRTSGEKRISNFLIWQAAYTEFVFTDVLWPDFSRKDLEQAISDYQTRDRRFGNLTVDDVA